MSMTLKTDLITPVRNRYFYGKLLDAYHFELETEYANAKRWLINRLVLGYGVVCGLDVVAGEPAYSVVIKPGVAIDKWGREIIVPKSTEPVPIPDDILERARAMPTASKGAATTGMQPHGCLHVQVVLCYHECPADPVPVLTGDCGGGNCAPGSIREQFRIEFKEGHAPPFSPRCRIPNVIDDGAIDYKELTKWVSRNCHETAKSPCIVLANLTIREGDPCPCKNEDIDISVRRIVYSNDLLFELLLGLTQSPQAQADSEK